MAFSSTDPAFCALDASAALREQQELGYLDMKRNKGFILYPEPCFCGKALHQELSQLFQGAQLPAALPELDGSRQGCCSAWDSRGSAAHAQLPVCPGWLQQSPHCPAWHPSDPLAPFLHTWNSSQPGCRAGFLNATSQKQSCLAGRPVEWHSLTLGELNNCRGAAHQVSAAVARFEAPRVCVLQGEPWVFCGEAVTHPREKNTRRGLGWVLGKISLQKGWSGTGTGCPGECWGHHSWKS